MRAASTAWTVGGTSSSSPCSACIASSCSRNPQKLALTAVERVLDITPEEVRAVAAARLRPDNRAVLVYEPVQGAESADDAADDTDAEGEAAQ